MCKVSVITPVYKVEKYLGKCIDSILNQSFKDFELIIVDDGSPDSCGKIADEYEKIDSRVKVIHKENGGAPSARNAGIEIAKGEYFYFPDSDDWLDPEYLQELVVLAEKTHAELVISGFTMEYYEQGKNQRYQVSVNEKLLNNPEEVRYGLHEYFDNMMMAVPWNKLYSASYIRDKDLRFPNLKWDDLHFNMDVIMDINRVAVSSSSGYHFFRSRAGSETTTVFDGMLYKKRKEQFEHILKVYDHWNIKDEKIMAALYGYYAARLVQCVQEISISNQIGITNIFGTQMLVPLGKEKIVFYSEVSGAIVDILINAALIPLFASAGAAFGTLLAEFVVLLVQFHGIKEYVKGFFKKIHSYKIMIAIMIASIISIWINRLSIGSFLILVISATIFFGTYFLILLFWKDALVVEIWNGVLDKCKKIVRK